MFERQKYNTRRKPKSRNTENETHSDKMTQAVLWATDNPPSFRNTSQSNPELKLFYPQFKFDSVYVALSISSLPACLYSYLY